MDHKAARRLWIPLAVLAVAVMVCIVVGTTKSSRRRGDGQSDSAKPARGIPRESASLLANPRTRAAAARQLGTERVAEAVPLLLQFTSDSDVEVRLACLWALVEIGDKQALQALRRAGSDKDRRIRCEAVRGLEKLYGDPVVLKGLMEALADEETQVRMAAAKVFIGKADKDAVKAVLPAAADANAEVRLTVMQGLAKVHAADIVPELVRALDDSDPRIGSLAEGTLAKIGEPAMSALVARLPQASRETRLTIVKLLAGMKTPKAVPGLVRAMAAPGSGSHKSPSFDTPVFEAAVNAIVALGDAAVEPLAEYGIRANLDPQVKAAVAATCRRIGSATVDPILQHLLKWQQFPHAEELKLWVRTLGDIGDPRALPGLDYAARQPVEGIADIVAEARSNIERRSGVKLLPPAAGDATISLAASEPDWAKALEPARAVDASPVGGAAGAYWFDATLSLKGALVRDGKRCTLELYLGQRDGAWRRHVMGWAGYPARGKAATPPEPIYNCMDHEGTVTALKRLEDRTLLDVEMNIHDDPWVPGGRASYSIDLKRDGQTLRGAFAGVFNGAAVQGEAVGSVRETLWPSPVEKYVPLQPGEHPRLIFRKSDLPELRRRMATPEGRVILARLDALLKEPWTLWHGAGYGLLYQLTGEAKYAELARQCVEDARTGRKQNPDARYSYFAPGHGGHMRAGPSYAAVALAYDLCYDAWDQAYREALAREILDRVFKGCKYQQGTEATGLVFQIGHGQLDPTSNHYGAWNGGGGTAVLAILGDPGVDRPTALLCHRVFAQRAKRALDWGFSDRAWFYEGHQCGRISTNTGLFAYLQALRVAAGMDMVQNCEAAQWLLTKWIFELGFRNGKVLGIERGMYCRDFLRNGNNTSESGDFCLGFGVCPQEHKPAVLWFYNRVLEPGEKTYDVMKLPHHAAYALANWPLGVKERDPAEILGHVLADRKARYYVFRSGWKGEDDVIATIGGTENYWNSSAAGMVTGMGLEDNPKLQRRVSRARGGLMIVGQFAIPGLHQHDAVVEPLGGGAYRISTPVATTVVDASGVCGAPLVLVTVCDAPPPPDISADLREQIKKIQGERPAVRRNPAEPPADGLAYQCIAAAEAGAYVFHVNSFQRGPAPAIEAAGEGRIATLVVGKRKLSYDGKKFALGAIEKEPSQ